MTLYRLSCLLVGLAMVQPGSAQPSDSATQPRSRALEPDSSFTPDPLTVQRFNAGYRYAQKGWIVLHVEGGPYERGMQHGRLLAPEIAGYLHCYAAMQCPGASTEGWKLTRTIVNTALLRGFALEYLEEMKGIADGASAAGARFDDRALDVVDIAALNLWPELMTLDAANDANPTGLEGMVFPNSGPVLPKAKAAERCSAFAATGKATPDGHPVIGHITMFSLYPSRFYNVWLDVKPDRGHRVTMQSYPGGIYSGMDYYLNDVGIAMVETTIEQTRLDPRGQTLASRVRQAMQYADSIDGVVAVLKESNNGLYNNEWLLADMKTDEIAMLELGTHSSKLWRSSKHEWYGGTEGFYWGCNNAKDLTMRLETIPAVEDRPANLVWHPSDRDLKWIELYRKNVGAMDEAFARRAFTTAPLCSSASVDAKFTSAALAKYQRTWATFGPPLERSWLPLPEEVRRFPDIQPLVSNPWTLIGIALPVNAPAKPGPAPADLHDPTGEHIVAGLLGSTPANDKEKEDVPPPVKPAWHGTILPASDADAWLASSFAEFEPLVSLEKGYADAQASKCLCSADYDKVSESVFTARAAYFSGVRLGGDVPLAQIKSDVASDGWYRIAVGKGILVLAELRRLMGDESFIAFMDGFGRRHAGKAVRSSEFESEAAKRAGRNLDDFFKYWLHSRGLPRLELVSAAASEDSVRGQLRAYDGPLPSNIEMTIESPESELTRIVALAADGRFEVKTGKPVTRLVVDKFARAARANGSQAHLGAFADEVDRTLIICGTRDEQAANREAAEACQKAIRAGWHNVDVPIATDASVSEDDLKTHHLILIGRPTANAITHRLASALPVTFGANSFAVRGQTYANMASTVLAAGVNPLNLRLTVTVIAGNSAAATLARAGELAGRDSRPEVKVFVPSGKPKSLIVPSGELVRTFDE